ncbi:ankyrin repeat domain-containing protein [Streptomyces sp. NPDC056194]|uniref:ankyrin repeat domain-containing protein n=1 Tax=unclassified Streptomyces TaxID=2593676 RepID=UPI0035E02749
MTDGDRYEMSAVHLAVETDDLAELTRLLDAGHDPNEVDGYSGWTPLLKAIDGEADGSVQDERPWEAACPAVLLAYGADPQRPSRDGLTPYHLAFSRGTRWQSGCWRHMAPSRRLTDRLALLRLPVPCLPGSAWVDGST